MKNIRAYWVVAAVIALFAIGNVTSLSFRKPAESPKTGLTVVMTSPQVAQVPTPEPTPTPKPYHYIEIVNACDWNHVGTCVNLRTGPGSKYPVHEKLRNGVVLQIGDSVVDAEGMTWYKVIFSTELRYPERVAGDLYVALTDSVQVFGDDGDQYASVMNASSTKRIVVDISQQKLYAYDGQDLFMEETISTGLEFTPTPRGQFFVFKKTPSRYMQGPIEGVSDQYYDLPGVPWDLYFNVGGAVIHGAYWHDKFGQRWSHGCVNLPLESAKRLYQWADVGTPVLVRD
jgi:hypothetical protein